MHCFVFKEKRAVYVMEKNSRFYLTINLMNLCFRKLPSQDETPQTIGVWQACPFIIDILKSSRYQIKLLFFQIRLSNAVFFAVFFVNISSLMNILRRLDNHFNIAMVFPIEKVFIRFWLKLVRKKVTNHI